MSFEYFGFLALTILFLATLRISNLVTTEDGPFDIFQRIRDYFYTENVNYENQGFFYKLLNCPLCFSVWVGFVFTITIYIYPIATLIIALPFALSSATDIFKER